MRAGFINGGRSHAPEAEVAAENLSRKQTEPHPEADLLTNAGSV